MSDVLREVLPVALAIALSPFPILPAILLLAGHRPRATGVAFLAGWFSGILAATLVFVLAAEIVQLRDDEPAAWASWARIVLGAGLLAYGATQWVTRHESGEPPRWMASLDDATPVSAARLGLLLAVANPKILVFAAAGGLAIGSAELTAAGDLGALVAFTVVAALGVEVPVLGYVVLGDRVRGPLARARSWLDANGAAVMAVVIVVIGLLLLVKGIQGL